MLIPSKAVLFQPLVASVACFITIHIDDTIAFVHLDSSTRNYINDAPHGIAQQVYAIFNGFAHLFNMRPQIINSVRVMDSAIRIRPVICTDAVFCNKYWQLVAVIHLVQRDAQAFGVNLPAPFAGLQIRVFLARKQVAAGDLVILVVGGDHGHICR